MIKDWLLCDFHIHTKFSDGTLPLEQVVNLYGENGFDAISITDHILDEKTFKKCLANHEDPMVIEREHFSDYLQTLWKETRRAWQEFGMLLIPGTEITNNHDGYHILGIDIKEYIDPGQPVENIVNEIHRQGGIAIAPHPHRGSVERSIEHTYLWDNHERFAQLFDAWEVANRDDLLTVIGLKKFNYIANSDFHEPHHLYSWKTLLRCEKNIEAIKSEIHQNNGVSIYLFREGKVI
ncbi:phosphotransferase [candidate division KSB1 bacterium]|nr:phosphotransferase [candidate division KSB1 bacterium]